MLTIMDAPSLNRKRMLSNAPVLGRQVSALIVPKLPITETLNYVDYVKQQRFSMIQSSRTAFGSNYCRTGHFCGHDIFAILIMYLLSKYSILSNLRSQSAKISCPRIGMFDNPQKYHVRKNVLSYNIKSNANKSLKHELPVSERVVYPQIQC